ncbi:UNVERIFIED_CONTAM: hypothetical protein Sradi_2093600 [Sesamum radiatum]|uniref:Reverse transcriptase Ty1/copia-type domain-containing protein n=1 Tax=Sesamum radiatum TaxID=300843 RepID=A0AAW2TJ14_SESRA
MAVHQLDINNAFFHGHLDEEALRQLNHEFTQKLSEFGFRQSAHDNCLFIKLTSDGFLALLVYVDDIFIMGPAEDLIKRSKLTWMLYSQSRTLGT